MRLKITVQLLFLLLTLSPLSDPAHGTRAAYASGPTLSSARLPPGGNFVYANNDSFPNTVSAYSVAADGTLTQIPGSPFLTGGDGVGAGGAGFYAAPRATTCAIGNVLYVSNAGSNDVSAFTIRCSEE
jgi:hypothetical protein